MECLPRRDHISEGIGPDRESLAIFQEVVIIRGVGSRLFDHCPVPGIRVYKGRTPPGLRQVEEMAWCIRGVTLLYHCQSGCVNRIATCSKTHIELDVDNLSRRCGTYPLYITFDDHI